MLTRQCGLGQVNQDVTATDQQLKCGLEPGWEGATLQLQEQDKFRQHTMGSDSFEGFSDLGATSAKGQPTPGASLHSTILGEDNLIVGATLMSPMDNAVADAKVASTAIAASPEDPVIGSPEKAAMTSPQGATEPPAEAAGLAYDERPGLLGQSSSRSEVNKVTWARVGSVVEPGRYMFRFGWISITAADLAVWRQYPNASFTLCQTAKARDEGEYRLGAFDIGDPNAG